MKFPLRHGAIAGFALALSMHLAAAATSFPSSPVILGDFVRTAVFNNATSTVEEMNHYLQRLRAEESPLDGGPADRPPGNLWNFFAQSSFYGTVRIDTAVTLSQTFTGGILLGVDRRITPDLVVGALFNYSNTTADPVVNWIDNPEMDTYAPGLYASYAKGGWYANAVGLYGFNTITAQPGNTYWGGNGTSSPNPGGSQAIGSLSGGYDFQVKTWAFGPTVAVQYAHMKTDSYREADFLGQNVTVAEQQSDSFRTRLGWQVRNDYPGWKSMHVSSALAISWQHEYLDPTKYIDARLDNGTASWLSGTTNEVNQNSVVTDLHMALKFSPTISLALGIPMQLGIQYCNVGANLDLKLSF